MPGVRMKAPVTAPAMPGVRSRKKRRSLASPNFAWAIPETPVVNTSATCALALATAGDTPLANKNVVEVTP